MMDATWSTMSVGAASVREAADAALDRLQRQVERASLHAHTALGESYARIGETQVLLHGLVDVLLAKGMLDGEELAAAIEPVRRELQARGEARGPGLSIRIQAPQDEASEGAAVDCEARLPICRAACCRLEFALSVDEIEAGHVRWDLGRPYFIRHERDGCCTHLGAGGGCGVYAHRPGVCRRYSCEHDTRIWNNFDRMELNTEWIAAHLGDSPGPRALQACMHVIPPPHEPASAIAKCETS